MDVFESGGAKLVFVHSNDGVRFAKAIGDILTQALRTAALFIAKQAPEEIAREQDIPREIDKTIGKIRDDLGAIITGVEEAPDNHGIHPNQERLDQSYQRNLRLGGIAALGLTVQLAARRESLAQLRLPPAYAKKLEELEHPQEILEIVKNADAEEVAGAVIRSLGGIEAAVKSIERGTEDSETKSISDVGLAAYALSLFCPALLNELLATYQAHYIPWAILKDPIGFVDDEECADHVFISHEVRQANVARPGKAEQTTRIFCGRYTFRFRFPLDPYAESSHFQFCAPEGVQLCLKPEKAHRGGAIAKHEVETVQAIFSSQDKDGTRSSFERERATWYRPRNNARSLYEALASADAGKPRGTRYGRQSLTGTIRAKEPLVIFTLSWAMLATAIAGLGAAIVTCGFTNNTGGGLPASVLLAAPLTIAVALGGFAFDKPILRRVVGWRTLIALIVAGVAWSYGRFIPA